MKDPIFIKQWEMTEINRWNRDREKLNSAITAFNNWQLEDYPEEKKDYVLMQIAYAEQMLDDQNNETYLKEISKMKMLVNRS